MKRKKKIDRGTEVAIIEEFGTFNTVGRRHDVVIAGIDGIGFFNQYDNPRIAKKKFKKNNQNPKR